MRDTGDGGRVMHGCTCTIYILWPDINPLDQSFHIANEIFNLPFHKGLGLFL